MILSAEQIFSDDQAVTATAISENVIDQGVAATPYGGKAALNRDLGKGTPIPVLIQVTEKFLTCTSVTVTLECSAAAGLTSPVVLASEIILLADLLIGKQTHLQFVPNGDTLRYLGVRYTVGGSNATAGKITAGISMGNQTNVTGA